MAATPSDEEAHEVSWKADSTLFEAGKLLLLLSSTIILISHCQVQNADLDTEPTARDEIQDQDQIQVLHCFFLRFSAAYVSSASLSKMNIYVCVSSISSISRERERGN